MKNTELDSFIAKFKGLWKLGLDANLELNSHAGLAWVGLRVRLGHAPLQPPFHFPPSPQKSRNGPARQRRREKRAAERAGTAENAAHNESEVKAEEAASTATVNVVMVDTIAETAPILDDVTEEVKKDIVDTSDIGTTAQVDESDYPNYCKICKDTDQIESAEDLSYHMMNDHDANKVIAIYGIEWIEERRYCIRRGSPFLKWFSTPPI